MSWSLSLNSSRRGFSAFMKKCFHPLLAVQNAVLQSHSPWLCSPPCAHKCQLAYIYNPIRKYWKKMYPVFIRVLAKCKYWLACQVLKENGGLCWFCLQPWNGVGSVKSCHSSALGFFYKVRTFPFKLTTLTKSKEKATALTSSPLFHASLGSGSCLKSNSHSSKICHPQRSP